MKVFSREKFFEKFDRYVSATRVGLRKLTLLKECDGKTKDECEKLGFKIEDDWYVEVEEEKPMTIKDFRTKKIAVWFDSLEQEKEFLKLCAENGVEWHGGQPADDFATDHYGVGKSGTVIACDGTIGYSSAKYAKGNGYRLVHASEFLNAAHKHVEYDISLQCIDEKTTVAKLIVNGRQVKKAIARCNPKDKFSIASGAKLALYRLFEKKN